jgi:cell division protein FtsA
VHSIQRAVEEAELMAGCQIDAVYAGIAGSHIRSLNSHGIVAIRDKEVTPADIERVLDAAQAMAIPADQKILHILPQEYVIDHQEGVKEPLGMSGVRLEAKVHLVTCAVNSAQNIEKCVRRCTLEVRDVILEQLASSYAVLTEDEKDLGVCLVDIGGGTTDVAIFTEGAIRHTANIPIAGDQVTNDIALALRTPTAHAEELPSKYACALTQLQKGPGPHVFQGLGVGVGRDEFHALHTLRDHVGNGVTAAAAHANDLDDRVLRLAIYEFKHCTSSTDDLSKNAQLR